MNDPEGLTGTTDVGHPVERGRKLPSPVDQGGGVNAKRTIDVTPHSLIMYCYASIWRITLHVMLL